MNRLNRILLAGTIVPSLVLAPFAGAFAQGGEQERHAPGGTHGGGPGGPGGPGHGEGGPRGGAAGGGGGGAPHAPAEHAVRPPAAAPAAAPKAEHTAPPARAERPAAAEHAAPAVRAAPTAPAARAERPAAPTAPRNTLPGLNPKPAPAHDAATHDATTPGHALPSAAAPSRTAPPAANRATTPNAATPPAAANRAAPGATPDATRNAADPAQGGARRAGEPGRPGGENAGRPGEGNRGDRAGRPGTPGARPGNPAAAGATPGTPAANPSAANPATAPNAGQNAAAPNGQRNNGQANGFNNGNNSNGNNGNNGGDRRGGISPGGAAAIGAAAGFAGGFLAATAASNLDGIRRDRREQVEDGRTYIREPGRTIVEDGDRSYIVHDENDRFRDLGYDVRRERRGSDFVDTIDRPDGTQIMTYTTPDGRMLRRVRRYRDGREFVLIDNSYNGGVRSVQEDIVDLPPPPIGIPRDRYDVAYQDADEGLIYDTFTAPPLQAPPRRYTLDQIRYSPDVRRYVRSVDINTINFDSGSWVVPAAATGKLRALASAVKRTVAKDPNTVFLVQGYTDATGNPTDNLSLSDRRAQSVAAILSKDFGIPPENLTTQGYGQQNLKENTQGPSAANRRVVIQNITPLLAAGGQPPQ